MADAPRARRLAERIQQIVAQMLDTRVKDPRLGFVTVTDVKVTGDLQNATVFYTVLGSEEDRAGTAAALASAKGLIRSEVGRQTGVRLTPTLEFVPDAVPETAASIEEALRAARERDAELARQAARASYAGDADPYRHREEDAADGGPDAPADGGPAGTGPADGGRVGTEPGDGAPAPLGEAVPAHGDPTATSPAPRSAEA